ncbi:N-acetylglucosaminylphosphatidylinositol deacetylase [Aphelenchoides fujianensis]|nr:N-acetylglucosaminylphosphatidylinositol deacetylase [Aphelenchoides fujianensis]
MFFGPTVVNLRLAGCRLSGIAPHFVTIMNAAGLQDGEPKWETEKLARIVLQHAERLDIQVIISFDEGGVSGHPNHIACFNALQFLYSNGHVPSGVQIFVLESVSLLRKYSGIFDFHRSYISTFLYCASAWKTWRAMREHRTQLVWFRYLYLLFSRYVTINTLKRISLHRLMIRKSK